MGLMVTIKPIGMHYGYLQSVITLERFELWNWIFTRCSFCEELSPEQLSSEFQSRILDSAMTENAMMCMCLSASISLEWLHRSSWNFLCMSIGAMVRSSSSVVMICYVLPVLSMMSHFVTMGPMGVHFLGRIDPIHHHICSGSTKSVEKVQNTFFTDDGIFQSIEQ